MTDWIPMPSFEQVARLTNTLQGHITLQGSGVSVFTNLQWQALKLWFSILDLDGKGVLVEESFVVLLAEQDTGTVVCHLVPAMYSWCLLLLCHVQMLTRLKMS